MIKCLDKMLESNGHRYNASFHFNSTLPLFWIPERVKLYYIGRIDWHVNPCNDWATYSETEEKKLVIITL